MGKVDEIKDKWPSDKKVESEQNVSQRGIPNSSPIIHPLDLKMTESKVRLEGCCLDRGRCAGV